MSFSTPRRTGLAASATAALALACAVATPSALAAHNQTGPSTETGPYLLGDAPVTTVSLLTVGDEVRDPDGGSHTMVGIPDGMGAFDNGDDTFTVLMNHELRTEQGITRDHGAQGAFISRYVVDSDTFDVLSGEDLIQQVKLSDGSGGYADAEGETAALNRLCSADLPDLSAFWNAKSKQGYAGRIFLSGEEAGETGRAFAHVVATGDSYELPDFGGASWENLVASPDTKNKTVVVGLDDTGGGEIYVYSGQKRKKGATPVDRAGLTGGVTLPVAVQGMPSEDASMPYTAGPKRFTLDAANATAWARPEDGAWDPDNPNDFYFATTASISTHSRLWKLSFDNVKDPAAGGTLELVLEGPALGSGGDASYDGSQGPLMMDNLTIDDGVVYVQEDPGGSAYLAGVFAVDAETGDFEKIATHDPALFTPGQPGFITSNEEASGIIPAPFLGKGAFLYSDQVHRSTGDPETVEMGQMGVMYLAR